MRAFLLLALLGSSLWACATPDSSQRAIENLRTTQPTPSG